MSHLLKTTASYPNALMLLITEDDPTVPEIDGVANISQSESMLALAVQHDAALRWHPSDGAPAC